MSDYLSNNLHTAAWTSYEVGLANAFNIPVVQLETSIKKFENSQKRLPVAHVDYLIYYDPDNNKKKDSAFQDIIDYASGIILIRRGQPINRNPSLSLINALDKYCTNIIECFNSQCRAEWKVVNKSGVYACPVCRKMYHYRSKKGFSQINGRGDYANIPESGGRYRLYQGAELLARVETINLKDSLTTHEKEYVDWDCYDYKTESDKQQSKRKRA